MANQIIIAYQFWIYFIIIGETFEHLLMYTGGLSRFLQDRNESIPKSGFNQVSWLYLS